MPYLVFEYDPQRDVQGFVYGLSIALLQPEKTLKVIASYPKKSNPDPTMTVSELLALYLKRDKQRSRLALELKLELTTDKFLVERFGDQYVGFVSKSVKKVDLLNAIPLLDRLREYEKLRERFSPKKWELVNTFHEGTFSEAQAEEFAQMCDVASRPLVEWLNNQAQATKDHLNSMKRILQRDF